MATIILYLASFELETSLLVLLSSLVNVFITADFTTVVVDVTSILVTFSVVNVSIGRFSCVGFVVEFPVSGMTSGRTASVSVAIALAEGADATFFSDADKLEALVTAFTVVAKNSGLPSSVSISSFMGASVEAPGEVAGSPGEAAGRPGEATGSKQQRPMHNDCAV